jgi:class 3 adenylate cyclase
MRETYADLLRVPMAKDPAATTSKRTQETFSETFSSYSEVDDLDLGSVMKASQAISGELRLEQLWKITLEILLENVGGQRGWFVMREQQGLTIAARAVADGEQAPLTAPIALDVEGDTPQLPVAVINTALRTREAVVLQDAAENPRFASDPYIKRERPKSVLCLPLHRRGHFEGAIYIENSLTAGAFSRERVEVVKLLSAQAAISMENAKLYGDQERLIEAQQRFVPSQFLESLGHPDIARVGLGEHVAKEMSVMFSDLRGFTSLSERLEPGEVIALLNAYFSSQSPPISRAGGFIDAYTGDEIMALFDAPPDGAVRAGIEMRRALEQHNRRSAAEGGPVLEAGIGMDTGPLVLGTVGGDDRLKCGVVGDVVNLSSRIEQLTKRYGVPFLIGDGTFRALAQPQRFSLRMVDRVAVKGKLIAVTLYEVLDAELDARRAAKESTRELLSGAHEHLAAREFKEACELLTEARSLDPDDRVLSLLGERAERYRDSPPTEAWQGFETLRTK